MKSPVSARIVTAAGENVIIGSGRQPGTLTKIMQGEPVGTLLLAAWLIAAATSDAWFDTVSAVLATPIGLIVLFGFTWSVMHHLLGGIRHFIWDTIHGFERGSVRLLSWLTIILSLALTGGIWMMAVSYWGKLIW